MKQFSIIIFVSMPKIVLNGHFVFQKYGNHQRTLNSPKLLFQLQIQKELQNS